MAIKIHPYFNISFVGKKDVKGKKGKLPIYIIDRIRPEYSKDPAGEYPNGKFVDIVFNYKTYEER